ncbi:MAG: hypothetical protein ACKOGA_08500, partial [Planctomycetaceae bacterium]
MATLFIAVTALSAAPPTARTATSGAQAGVVAGQEAAWEAGLATRDLTPQTPIRLSGFGGRR